MTSAPIVEVDHLHVELPAGRDWVTVVDDVTFAVEGGELVGLVGESGSGKTMTGLALLGLHDRRSTRVTGRVMVDGLDVTRLSRRHLDALRGDRIAMVFQEPMTSLNPAFTIGEQIAETVRRHRGASRRAARARAVELLSRVGIADAARRSRSYPHEFSGGMRQRVAIAIALSCDPKVLVADEPTTALDVTVQARILDLLQDMQRENGMAVILVSHDLGVVAERCDRVLVMYAGQIVEEARASDAFFCPAHPYTEALLATLPQLAPRSGQLATIPGSAPRPFEMPAGCRFHPRCTHALASCSAAAVELLPLSSTRSSRCVLGDALLRNGHHVTSA